MTCRECLEQFSDLSVDDVSISAAQLMREHMTACPQCQHEWVIFEQTLFVLSTSSQPLPGADASQAMWEHCSEHIFQKVETNRQRQAGLAGWFARQPRWSWITFGAAVTILGATWAFAPHDEAINALRDSVSTPGTLITLQRPPAIASGLVNHHSAMNADPFTDNVGSTLVSYSATSPKPQR